MKKIEYKSKVIRYANFGEYIVELNNDFFTELNATDIYIYNKKYGVKMHCIGLVDMEQKFIDKYILENVEDWIDIYQRDYED